MAPTLKQAGPGLGYFESKEEMVERYGSETLYREIYPRKKVQGKRPLTTMEQQRDLSYEKLTVIDEVSV